MAHKSKNGVAKRAPKKYKKPTAKQAKSASSLRKKGYVVREIATRTRLSKSTVGRIINSDETTQAKRERVASALRRAVRELVKLPRDAGTAQNRKIVGYVEIDAHMRAHASELEINVNEIPCRATLLGMLADCDVNRKRTTRVGPRVPNKESTQEQCARRVRAERYYA